MMEEEAEDIFNVVSIPETEEHIDLILDGHLEDISSWRGETISDHLLYLTRYSRIRSQDNKPNEIWKRMRLNDRYPTTQRYISVDTDLLSDSITKEVESCRAGESSTSMGLNISPAVQFSLLTERTLSTSLGDKLLTEFETGSYDRRLHIVLSELHVLSIFYRLGANRQAIDHSQLLTVDAYEDELYILVPLSIQILHNILSLRDIMGGIISTGKTKYILSAFYNLPHMFEALLDALITLNEEVVKEILSTLSRKSKHIATRIRAQLVEHQVMPSLVISLSMQLDHHIQFLNALFWREDHAWLKPIFESYNRHDFNGMEEESSQPHDIQILKDNLFHTLGDPGSSQSSDAAAHLLCGLVGIHTMELSSVDVDKLLQGLSISRSPSTTLSVVCILLIAKDIYKTADADALKAGLRSIVKEGCQNEGGETHAVAATALLLFALQLHTEQYEAAVQTVRNLLEAKVQIHQASYVALSKMITEDIMPESYVVERVISIPIHGEKHEGSGFLLLEAVLECMKGPRRLSVHHGFAPNLRDFVCEMIMTRSDTIHPHEIEIINEYIACTLSSENGTRMQMDLIAAVFNEELPLNETQTRTRLILVAYYTLHYNEQSHRLRQEDKKLTSEQEGYSREVIEKIPIKNILDSIRPKKRKNGRKVSVVDGGCMKSRFTLEMEKLYAAMYGFAISQCPQLFNVSDQLYEEDQLYSTVDRFSEPELLRYCPENSVEDSDIFRGDDYFLQMERLSTLPVPSLFDHLPRLLKHSTKREEIFHEKSLKKISLMWYNCYLSDPQRACVILVNSLGLTERNLRHEDLLYDPMVLFQLEDICYTHPVVLDMVLKVIQFYTVCSRRNLEHSGQTQKKQEEVTTLILSTESTIIQQLLELCIYNGRSLENSVPQEIGDIQEIRMKVCLMIHDIFMDNPLMAKLVHFQGYHHTLIPVTVEGIPSMHICLDFIPELLAQPHTRKQIFATKLGATLAQKYPIPKSLDCVRTILHFMRSRPNINEIKSVSTYEGTNGKNNGKEIYILHTLDQLYVIACAFPSVTEEVVSILVELTPQKHECITFPLLQQLSQLVNETLEKIMNRL